MLQIRKYQEDLYILEDARALLAGTLPHPHTPGMPCDTYQGQWTAFYCTEEDLLNAKR